MPLQLTVPLEGGKGKGENDCNADRSVLRERVGGQGARVTRLPEFLLTAGCSHPQPCPGMTAKSPHGKGVARGWLQLL